MKTNVRFLSTLAILLSIPFLFSNCSKDEDPTTNELLQGDWDIIAWIEGSTPLNISDYNSLTFSFSSTDDRSGTFIFAADGKDSSDDFSIPGTYNLSTDEKTLSIIPSIDEDPIQGTLSISGDEFQLVGNYIDNISQDPGNAIAIQARKR